MTARRVTSAYLLVLLTSALFISVSSVTVPTPAHAVIRVNNGNPVFLSPSSGPAGTWVSFGPWNVTGTTGTTDRPTTCMVYATYANFFSPKTGTAAASPTSWACSVTGSTWISGSFKVRDPTEIDATYPLPHNNYTVSIVVTLANAATVTPNNQIVFRVTPKIEFALTNLSPWKNNVGHDSSLVVRRNQTVYVHGWGFNSSDTYCDFTTGAGLTISAPSCSISQGELTDGEFTVIPPSSGTGVVVTVTGRLMNDTAAGSISVVVGPSIVLAPNNGSRGTRVTIYGTGFSLSDSDSCAVSYKVTGGGPLYASAPTCTMTTVGSWRQPSTTFEVASTATPYLTYYVTVTGSTGDNATNWFRVNPTANITLSSNSGTAGSVVTVSSPGPTYFSYLDVGACTIQSGPTNIIATSNCFIAYNATAGGGTLFLTSFVVSGTGASGVYSVNVRATPDGTGAYSATVGYAITIKVALNPTSGSPPLGTLPGTSVAVSGSGFSTVDTGCTIASFPSNSTMPNIASSVTCSVTNGVLTASFVVAAGAVNQLSIAGTPTLYTIMVTGTPGGDKANATFKIDPRILFTPSTGAPGVRVDLSGSGFAGGFGGKCTSNSSTPATLFQTVAGHRTTCNISPDGTILGSFWVNASAPDGGYLVTVQGRNAADQAWKTFPKGAAPTLTLTPSPATAGTLVTVSGSGWSSLDTSVILNVTGRSPAGGKYRDLWSPLNSTLTCPVTSGTIGTCTFALTNALGGARTISANGTRYDFTFATFVVQTKFTMSPGSGARGTVVTLSGSGFQRAVTNQTGCPNDFSLGTSGGVVSPEPLVTQLNCTIDEHGTLTGAFKVIKTSSAGTHTITVVNSTLVTQGSVTGDSGFEVRDPTILLSRTSGPRTTLVTVSGNYFNKDDTGCTITGPAPNPAVQPGTTTCSVSSGVVTGSFQVNSTAAPGVHALTVTGTQVTNDVASASFVVTPAISLIPSSGRSGTSVVVTGSNFANPGDNGACTITSSTGNIISSPICQISGGTMLGSFTVASSTGGNFTVTVTGLTGHAGSASFVVPLAPTLTLNPTSGLIGQWVSASGSNFAGTTCLLSAVPSNLFLASSCSISSGTLSGGFTVGSGAGTGSYTVTVQSNLGESPTAVFTVGITTTTALTTSTLTSVTTATTTPTQTTTAVTTSTSVTTSPVTTTIFTSATTTRRTPQCVIATATFGSEVSWAVQLMRNFRDRLVLSTRAGSAFMEVFNAWYYSFSPSVANVIANNDPLRAPVKVLLYPLLGLLGVSSLAYSLFSAAPEFAVVVAGLVASSLIGLVYLTLPAVVGMRALVKKRRIRVASIGKASVTLLAAALALLAVGELAGSFLLLAVGGSAVVLICLVSVPAIAALAMLRPSPD